MCVLNFNKNKTVIITLNFLFRIGNYILSIFDILRDL